MSVRISPACADAAEAMARLVGVPENAVYNLAVILMSAQFAPLLASRGLSLDLLEEELVLLLSEARRVVATMPAPPAQVAR